MCQLANTVDETALPCVKEQASAGVLPGSLYPQPSKASCGTHVAAGISADARSITGSRRMLACVLCSCSRTGAVSCCARRTDMQALLLQVSQAAVRYTAAHGTAVVSHTLKHPLIDHVRIPCPRLQQARRPEHTVAVELEKRKDAARPSLGRRLTQPPHPDQSLIWMGEPVLHQCPGSRQCLPHGATLLPWHCQLGR